MDTKGSTPPVDSVTVEDILDDDVTPLSLTEIFNEVVAKDEIILTIPAAEEAALRQGLAGVKAKQNTKLKSAGLQPDTATLSFRVTPHPTITDAIKVHILLSKKQTITVLAMELPDDKI